MPELTARVVRAAFPKVTLAVRIREALGPLFEDKAFAGAFAVRGRPAVSPGASALVSLLQSVAVSCRVEQDGAVFRAGGAERYGGVTVQVDRFYCSMYCLTMARGAPPPTVPAK
ncbi:hypothetical protein ACFCWG_12410 [Streptomyces sp. NPDC056390]|uniref:hypothetical protein n=1 Tax=Streptomyces sp. NPDC056390 TaxID=3345806 RepID=UPI0035D64F4C